MNLFFAFFLIHSWLLWRLFHCRFASFYFTLCVCFCGSSQLFSFSILLPVLTTLLAWYQDDPYSNTLILCRADNVSVGIFLILKSPAAYNIFAAAFVCLSEHEILLTRQRKKKCQHLSSYSSYLCDIIKGKFFSLTPPLRAWKWLCQPTKQAEHNSATYTMCTLIKQRRRREELSYLYLLAFSHLWLFLSDIEDVIECVYTGLHT